MGLNMAINLNVRELLVMGDSDLLIRQAQGDWETRDIKLIPYKKCVEDLSKRFKSIEFRYIPRFHNELADALATLASMLPYLGNTHIDPLEIQIRYQHGYCNTIEVEPDGEPWYHDIKQFLKAREYPEHANRDQKRTIRRLSNGFFLSGEILYKRTLDLNLLRCVDAKEAEMIMNEVHSGVCGPHMNGYVLAKKILRVGYYWLTMERDCFHFVRKCHQCQIHTIILKAVTNKAVVDFVHSNIICRFGIPKIIITDNAANVNSHLMKEVCEQFKIEHRNSTPYRPKVNGAVEAANKNIKKILRKMIQGSRQWYEKLPFALLGYRTTVRTSVGATPYLLVYGTEAIIPAEIEIPSLRIIVEAGIEDTEWVKSRLEQLNLIDEKRLVAVEAKGKFAPNWQGPYLVKKVLSKGALHLVDIEGKVTDISVNADAVKRYYVVFAKYGLDVQKIRFHLSPEKVEHLISIPVEPALT
ncbi:uncharacterized protein LOC142168024 [Nicotiana tabacum]|uniref:Uncharacterized protein LOC142168024 n=1 Tax=Nicotiana tabacum TaxID=4097 RepID=A0AC58SIH1_TOBAC